MSSPVGKCCGGGSCAAAAGGSFDLSSAAKEGNGAAIRLTERKSRALEVIFILLIRI